MKLSRFKELINRKSRAGWMATIMIMTLLMSACSSEEGVVENPVDQLKDLRFKDMHYSVSLNGEELPDAFGYFVSVPLTDTVKLVLKGVHPTEKLDIPVSATRDMEGNIVFEANDSVKNIRHFHVSGVYRRNEAEPDKSSMKVEVTYTVPNSVTSEKFEIPFDGRNGFCYNRDFGQYPMSKWDIEGQRDTCEWICNRINAELVKDIKMLSFSFSERGEMTVSRTSAANEVSSRTFRYWLNEGYDDERNLYVDIENPELFYDFLHAALGINVPSGSVSYLPEGDYTTAEIYIDKVGEVNNYSRRFSQSVVVRDNLRYNIFSYFRDKYDGDASWTDKERRFLNTMIGVAKRNYSGRIGREGNYEWAFATWKDGWPR